MVDKPVVVHAQDDCDDEEEEEEEQGEVDVRHHLVPVSHLLLEGGRVEREGREGR